MNTETAFNIILPLPEQLFRDLSVQPDLLVKLLPEECRLALNNYLIQGIKNKDGGPSIVDLHLRNWEYQEDTHAGTFRFYFRVHRNYTCSALEAAQLDYLDFSFTDLREEFVATATYFYWDLDN